MHHTEIKEKDSVLMVSLARISFLSLAEKIILLKNIDSSLNLALLSIEEISEICKRQIRSSSWNGKQNLLHAQREVAILESKGISFLSYFDKDYPALLRETPNAPFLLFYRGNKAALLNRSVSVVGTRHISPYAKVKTMEFAYQAAFDGCTVVSGLANGVDGASHMGVLNAWYDAVQNNSVLPEGKTVAVLPCGIDTIVPYNHISLASRIISSGGCLVSEYVPGVPAESWRFVQRNRIIASLSPATVVIQAPAGSGALITAQFALEYNRDVMFHKAAFETQANLVSEKINQDLQRRFALGEIQKNKLENTPQKYLESGAPVINDYKDYCRCLKEMPGLRSIQDSQLIFEELYG
ncbi:MAG: DNA-protecting protein DprA [Treponema sp.]|nr:DNA-protecting protein DprA [Treponema sp.]